MRGFDFNPQLRWLFWPTHPDDEMGIVMLLRRLVKARATVFVAWTHSNPEREQESREVMRRIGVPQENLAFLGATDGNIPEEMPELLPRFQRIIARAKPDRMACCAFEQGHLDHDATHVLVRKAFSGPVFEWPMYHSYITKMQHMGRFADPTGVEALILEPDEQALKVELAKCFPSTNLTEVLAWYEIWRSLAADPSKLRTTEYLRLATHADFRMPNLPDPMRTKVRACIHWHRWLTALAALEQVAP